MRAALAVALTSALLATACGSDELGPVPSGVSASSNGEVVTVVDVRWATDVPSIGYVTYGTSASLDQTSAMETESTTSHTRALLELAADTLYYYQVVTWDGHDAARSPVQTVRTAALPAEVPVVSVSGDTTDDGFNELTLVPVTGDATVVTVFASSGDVVWYHVEDSDRQVTRAQFSADRTSVLYNALGGAGAEADSAIVRVALDGSSSDSISVPGLGQDFVVLADGTLVALAADERDSGGATLRGDQLVEIDASGTITPVWSSWDCFDPADFPGDGPDGEWTGANALGFDSGDSDLTTDDSYFVGLRNLSTVVRVGRESHQCDAILGTAAATIDFADPASAFVHPGNFFGTATSLAVIDADGAGDASRLVEYALDTDTKMATETWSYQPDPPIHIDALGGIVPLTHKRRYVNWSTAGRLEVVGDESDDCTPCPTVVWSLDAAPGVTLGYHVRTDSLYRAPVGSP